MALVKMKRLCAIVPSQDRRAVLHALYRLGCVEPESAVGQAGSGSDSLLCLREENTGAVEKKARLTAAAAALDRYAPCKVSFFAPRRTVTEQELFSRAALDAALAHATEILALTARIDEGAQAQNRLASRIAALTPWISSDVPLAYAGSAATVYHRGVLPASAEMDAVCAALEEQIPASRLERISADREQYYVALMTGLSDEGAALALLKSNGFAQASFRGYRGTAAEEIETLRAESAEWDADRARQIASIEALSGTRDAILRAMDAYTQEVGQDAVLSAAGQTRQTVVLTGWVPAEAEAAVADTLTARGCAWQFTDPVEGDVPPTAVKNGRLVDPFVGVTDMYGTPTYDSLIDPNPMMSVFYFTFFGFIMGDAMYGLLMIVGCLLYLKLKRPDGSMKRMVTLFAYCGVSTVIAGALTGSWFADAGAAISLWLTGTATPIPPLWFDPLTNPMQMLMFSLALGAVQIVTGMALSATRMIREGHPLDALFDIGSWYVVFAGIGLLAMGISAGPYLLAGGVLMLLLTGGRRKKGLGRIVGGFGALYSVTGYLSDLLSYSRIMALGMAGAVVGQVVNKIATMVTGIPGLVLFVAVFVFGHVFNLAISLLGAYVHTCRLQYIEFYGRFFEDGGRAFRPLANHTKYVEIIKEDQ